MVITEIELRKNRRRRVSVIKQVEFQENGLNTFENEKHCMIKK